MGYGECSSHRALQGYVLALTVVVIAFLLPSSEGLLRKHSLKAPFMNGLHPSSIPHWSYGGSTAITQKYVRLVPAIRSRRGYIWNTEPVDTSDWQVEFSFRIHDNRDPGADGLAFWYVSNKEYEPGNLYGHAPRFTGFAVFFDTFDNSGEGDGEIIVGVLNDGSAEVGTEHNGLEDSFGYCDQKIRNTDHEIFVRITHASDNLLVEVDNEHRGAKYSRCFSQEHVRLPTGYHFGITAATGGHSDYHDLYSFHVKGGEEIEATTATGDDDASGLSELEAELREHAKQLFDGLDGEWSDRDIDAVLAGETMKTSRDAGDAVPSREASEIYADETRERLRRVKEKMHALHEQTSRIGGDSVSPERILTQVSENLEMFSEAIMGSVDGIRASIASYDIGSQFKRTLEECQAAKSLLSDRSSGVRHTIEELKDDVVTHVRVQFEIQQQKLDRLQAAISAAGDENKKTLGLLSALESRLDSLTGSMHASTAQLSGTLQQGVSWSVWAVFGLIQGAILLAAFYARRAAEPRKLL